MKNPFATSYRSINWWPIGALAALLVLPVIIVIYYSTGSTGGDREIIAPVGHYSERVKAKGGECVQWSTRNFSHLDGTLVEVAGVT